MEENVIKTAETQQKKKGALLIVDDDKFFLKLMVKIFEKHYEIRTADSGEAALKVLSEGFTPGVILSDQVMPGIQGSEFLQKSIQYVPLATRVIITGHTNPKDIIEAINQAHAYMYMTKPVEEIQIVQSIKIAFDYHNSKLTSQKTIAELNTKIEELKSANMHLSSQGPGNKLFLYSSFQVLSKLQKYSELYHFKNHLHNVVGISMHVAKELGFNNEEIIDLNLSANLFCLIQSAMPLKFYLTDPFDLSEEEQKKYFEVYLNLIKEATSNILLANNASTLVQVWEHNDGSGLPQKLTGHAISKEAYILSLANMYHNSVYRIQPESLPTLRRNGFLVQDRETTFKRHNEAVKLLYRRANWFDLDAFQMFIDLIKKHTYTEFKPVQESLSIKIFDLDQSFNSKSLENIIEEGEIPVTQGSDSFSIDTKSGNDVDYVEMELPVSKLQSGMIVSHSIVTKKGMLVVKPETTLDALIIKKVKTLEATGSLPSHVTVLVPKSTD